MICLLILERGDERERERKGRVRETETEKRERERDVKKKHPFVVSHVRWIKPTTYAGNQTHSLLVYRMTLQPTEPPGQGKQNLLIRTFLVVSDRLTTEAQVEERIYWLT